MKSIAELNAIRDKKKMQVDIREGGDKKYRIVVGMATCGIAAGARPVLTKISDMIQTQNLSDAVVEQTGCIGLCQFEPIVEIYEAGGKKTTYCKVDAEKAEEIVEQHIKRGQSVREYELSAADLEKK
ncbi:MAG: (2Fe-2S) ferredoxin domain-containing protein [Ruminococcus sp.]|jgi:NADP-reducing hydrogenase subunit HndB|nr:(2Fe-2S) ferredoxin domain-containing protein [Ruminococcus sp.]